MKFPPPDVVTDALTQAWMDSQAYGVGFIFVDQDMKISRMSISNTVCFVDQVRDVLPEHVLDEIKDKNINFYNREERDEKNSDSSNVLSIVERLRDKGRKW